MAISENSEFSAPSELSMTTSTSASLREATPWPPAKITSCIVWPRIASGDCSPSAHRTASVMFDLPDPFGPTITLTPGPNSSRVRSGNDLKPFRVIDFRCTGSGLRRLERGPRRRLLGLLLAAPGPAPDLALLDHRRHREGSVVWRPLPPRALVGDNLAAGGQQLLQLGFGVRRPLERLGHLRGE